jgi:hypothetical protein
MAAMGPSEMLIPIYLNKRPHISQDRNFIFTPLSYRSTTALMDIPHPHYIEHMDLTFQFS